VRVRSGRFTFNFEWLQSGSLLQQFISPPQRPPAGWIKQQRKAGVGQALGAISKSEAYERPTSAPLTPIQSLIAKKF